jgi:hypothetical protein
MNCKRAICKDRGRQGHVSCPAARCVSKARETHLGSSILTSDSVGSQLQVGFTSNEFGVVSIVQVTVDDLLGQSHRSVVESSEADKGEPTGQSICSCV